MNSVTVEPIGNYVSVSIPNNSLEVGLINIETDRYFLTQFQVTEEHKEAGK